VKSFIRIGVDLAKNFLQVPAIEREGAPPVTRKLSRAKFREFFARCAPTRVGMEACGSAHYWARELRAMGHEVVLMAPAYTKPYVKRGKNDAVDAGAVWEAMSRPDMRFVPIKSADQQAVLMLHKTRDLLIKQLLALAFADAGLPEDAREAVKILASHGEGLDAKIERLGDENRRGQREQPGESSVGRGSRHRPADRLCDGGERSRSERVQVREGFQRVSGPDAKSALQRRQGEARRHAGRS
jgi:transposase